VRVVSGGGQGETGSIENDVILEGPAIRVLREAVGVVQQRTGFSSRFEQGKLEREDRPAYALFALREGLVNAMVHRDYTSMGGSVQVDIFRDHLIIRNPGELPKGWTTGDLAKKHESHPANPDIARVFYLRELMEQLGMGTQKLIGACKELNAKSPVWKTERGAVFLTLFAAPEPSETISLVGRQARFLEKAKLGAEFKVSDYSDAAKVSERQARRDLAELEKVGFVERHGRGPATLYRRTSRFPGRSIRPNPAKSGQGKI
jgi:ATP-dependent DNA helicase RecG